MIVDQEALAKKRFMALNLVRLCGVVMVLIGLLFAADKIAIAQPPRHIIGIVFIVLGMLDVFLMPRILRRGWKSPN